MADHDSQADGQRLDATTVVPRNLERRLYAAGIDVALVGLCSGAIGLTLRTRDGPRPPIWSLMLRGIVRLAPVGAFFLSLRAADQMAWMVVLQVLIVLIGCYRLLHDPLAAREHDVRRGRGYNGHAEVASNYAGDTRACRSKSSRIPPKSRRHAKPIGVASNTIFCSRSNGPAPSI